MYACPHCHRVTQARSLVRYCRGLTEFGSQWMCSDCLAELRAEEAGPPSLDTAWGVQVVEQEEATEPVAKAA